MREAARFEGGLDCARAAPGERGARRACRARAVTTDGVRLRQLPAIVSTGLNAPCSTR
ncbi:hypothetical protein FEP39_05514 [Burkholderia multivorans]|nr:hypothetical protein NP80_5134 [Burkholderia multivorans ATCC BAA-247]MDR8920901.1 hypothetical protein [Burkholderia multivorans]MDR8926981.1 hypothetical protein [Burkholderia multivorans]MDR8968847.1 hypothetical protein [Burkholderia multivorans]MDR8993329.1 hypothetical protein [Burkholderia multivorans]